MKRFTRYSALFVFVGALFTGVADLEAGVGADCAAYCHTEVGGSGCPEPKDSWIWCVGTCLQQACGSNQSCYQSGQSEAQAWCYS
jgi:hypothetical protein